MTYAVGTMPAARWRGSKHIQESPESPSLVHDESGIRWTRVFNGPFDALKAAKPSRGDQMRGYRGFFVNEVALQKGKGGTGIMTIQLIGSPPRLDFDSKFSDELQMIPELEWMEVQKPLESHPRYSDEGGSAFYLTDEDWLDIEEWKSLGTRAQKTAKFSDLASNAQEFCQKLMRGNDSYVDFSPMVRLTTFHKTKPSTGRCGRRETPPYGLGIEGYEFLKTADRVIRQHLRSWQRVQEWTGAHLINQDLYPDT